MRGPYVRLGATAPIVAPIEKEPIETVLKTSYDFNVYTNMSLTRKKDKQIENKYNGYQ